MQAEISWHILCTGQISDLKHLLLYTQVRGASRRRSLGAACMKAKTAGAGCNATASNLRHCQGITCL